MPPLRDSLALGLLVCLLMTAACGAPEYDERATVPTPSAGQAGTAELPTSFPNDFPLPPEFEITEATFTEGDAFTQANYLVRGTSPMSVSELTEFYLGRLPEAGYTLYGEPPPPGTANPVLMFGNEAIQNGSVQLSEAAGATNVLLSLPLQD